jgi:hypothetical protein
VRSGLRADPYKASDFYTRESTGSTGKQGDTNGGAGRPKQSRLCIIFCYGYHLEGAWVEGGGRLPPQVIKKDERSKRPERKSAAEKDTS